MSKHKLTVEIISTNVRSQIFPFVQCDAAISSCFKDINFILVQIEFQNHCYMVKLTRRKFSDKATSNIFGFKEKKVSCVSFLEELFFTYVIESPRFVYTHCTFIVFFAQTEINVSLNFRSPGTSLFLISTFENNLSALVSFESDCELQSRLISINIFQQT